MSILVVGVFALLALSDFPPIIKEKKWYELAILSVLYLCVLSLAILQSMQIHIPSPMKGAQFVISELLGLKYPNPS